MWWYEHRAKIFAAVGLVVMVVHTQPPPADKRRGEGGGFYGSFLRSQPISCLRWSGARHACSGLIECATSFEPLINALSAFIPIMLIVSVSKFTSENKPVCSCKMSANLLVARSSTPPPPNPLDSSHLLSIQHAPTPRHSDRTVLCRVRICRNHGGAKPRLHLEQVPGAANRADPLALGMALHGHPHLLRRYPGGDAGAQGRAGGFPVLVRQRGRQA